MNLVCGKPANKEGNFSDVQGAEIKMNACNSNADRSCNDSKMERCQERREISIFVSVGVWACFNQLVAVAKTHQHSSLESTFLTRK